LLENYLPGQRTERKQRLRKTFAIFAGLILATVCTYLAILGWYDGERIRSTIIDEVLERYSVSIEIDHLERQFGLRPRLFIEGFRVANAEHMDRTLIEIESANLRVYPLSFLLGPVTVADVNISGLNITVPVDDEGAEYWDPIVAAISDWLHRFDWSIRKFDVQELRTSTRHARRGNELLVSAARVSGTMPRAADLTILASDLQANLETTLPLRLHGTAQLDSLALRQGNGELPVKFTVDGRIGNESLTIDAEGGNLLAGDPSLHDPVRALIRLGGASAQVNGSISRDNLTHVALLFDTYIPAEDETPALHARFLLSDPELSWRLSAIHARRGDSELAGEIHIDNSKERRFFGGKLRLINVSYPEEESTPETDGASVKDVLPEGDLFENLLSFSRQFDADFRLQAKNSNIFGIPFEELRIRTTLDNGAFDAILEKAQIQGVPLAASFHILPQPENTSLKLDAELHNMDVADLLDNVEMLDGISGKFDGSLSLEANGEKFAEVRRTMSGKIELNLVDGRMPDKLATRLAGDVLTALFTDFEDDFNVINCAIVDWAMKDGVARSQTMLMDTESFNLYGSGEIRLPDESVNIELIPKAKDFSLLSMRLPLRIRGTFDDLKVDPDVSEGIASLLTPIDLGLEADTDCAQATVAARAAHNTSR
jgi:uncharacterized protein involved in outer membrane biogenesis